MMEENKRKTAVVNENEIKKQQEYCKKTAFVISERYAQKPLACVVTYGCQQNVADSEHIKGMLDKIGYGFTENRTEAQLIIFNTCAVREHAEDRVFGNVGMLKSYKRQNPDVIIACCGCMMQQQHIADKIKKSFPFVDLVFGTHVVYRLPELLYNALTRKKRVFELPDMDGAIAEGVPVLRDNDKRHGCRLCTAAIIFVLTALFLM